MKNSEETNSRRTYSLLDWYKFITATVVTVVVVYKIGISDLVFDFSGFDFNALLALLLSLFAIGLSVAFYFKATDTSNLFYDNTYKFTKEISEILGRIEAGFGERLRHLDEGYTGLVNKFDNGQNEINIRETKEEIEIEKNKLKQEIEERNRILNVVLEKSQLQSHEKDDIKKQLKEKEIEIIRQRKELNFLRTRLKTENEGIDHDNTIFSEFVEKYLMRYITQTGSDLNALLRFPISSIINRFKIDIKSLSQDEINILRTTRVMDENGLFTIHGVRLLRHTARKML